MEKPADAGNPVVTVNALDCVLKAGVAMVAVTRTEVCWVPALTTVRTVPSAAEVAEAGERLRPPTVEFSANATLTPGRAPPVESTTLKITEDVSANPVPFNPIDAGVAETNWMEPTAAAATVIVPVAVKLCEPTVALAVMTSEPLQPLAVYAALTLPVVVVTVPALAPATLLPDAATAASPCATQGELKVTDTEPPVYRVPVWSTIVTVRLVVPPADRLVLEVRIMPDWKLPPVPLPME
jgi:hypothetical protein